MKSAPEYTEAALDEIELLNKITQHDPKDDKHVVHLLDHFYHRGPNGKHVCMVFETLGCSLLDLIKRTNYRGLPLPIVKRIARQVLVGLDYMHSLQIIHTDLKVPFFHLYFYYLFIPSITYRSISSLKTCC